MLSRGIAFSTSLKGFSMVWMLLDWSTDHFGPTVAMRSSSSELLAAQKR